MKIPERKGSGIFDPKTIESVNLWDPNAREKLLKQAMTIYKMDTAMGKLGRYRLGTESNQSPRQEDYESTIQAFMGQLRQMNPKASYTPLPGGQVQINLPGEKGVSMVRMDVNPMVGALTWRGQTILGEEPGDIARHRALASAIADLGNVKADQRLATLTERFDKGFAIPRAEAGGHYTPGSLSMLRSIFRPLGEAIMERFYPKGEKRPAERIQEMMRSGQLPPNTMVLPANLQSPGGVLASQVPSVLGVGFAFTPEGKPIVAGPDLDKKGWDRLRLQVNMTPQVTKEPVTLYGNPVMQTPRIMHPEDPGFKRPIFDSLFVLNYPAAQAVAEVSQDLAERTAMVRRGRRRDPIPVQNLYDINLAIPQGEIYSRAGRELPIYTMQNKETGETNVYSAELEYGVSTQIRSQRVDLPFREESYRYIEQVAGGDLGDKGLKALRTLKKAEQGSKPWLEAQRTLNEELAKAKYALFLGGGTGEDEDAMANIITEYAFSDSIQGSKLSGPVKAVAQVVSRFAPMSPGLAKLAEGAEVLYGTKEPLKMGSGLVEGLVNSLYDLPMGQDILKKYGIKFDKEGVTRWNPAEYAANKEEDPYLKMARDLLTTDEGKQMMEEMGLMVRNQTVYEAVERNTASGLMDQYPDRVRRATREELSQYFSQKELDAMGTDIVPLAFTGVDALRLKVSTGVRLITPSNQRLGNLSYTEISHLIQSGVPKEQIQDIVDRMKGSRGPAVDLVKAALNLPPGGDEEVLRFGGAPTGVMERALEMYREKVGGNPTEAPPQFYLEAGKELYGDKPFVIGDDEKGYRRYPSFSSLLHYSNIGLEGTDTSALTAAALKSMFMEESPIGEATPFIDRYQRLVRRAAGQVSTLRNLAGSSVTGSQTGAVTGLLGLPLNTVVGLTSRIVGAGKEALANIHRWPHTSGEQYGLNFRLLGAAKAMREMPWLRRFMEPAMKFTGGAFYAVPAATVAATQQADFDADTMLFLLNRLAEEPSSAREVTRAALAATGFNERQIASLTREGKIPNDYSAAWKAIFSQSAGLKGILKPGDWLEQFGGDISEWASKLLGGIKTADPASLVGVSEQAASAKMLVGSVDVSVEALNRAMQRYAHPMAKESGVGLASVGMVKTDVIDAAAKATMEEQTQRYGFMKRNYWGNIFNTRGDAALWSRIMGYPQAYSRAGFDPANLYPLFTSKEMSKAQVVRMQNVFSRLSEREGVLTEADIYHALTGKQMEERGVGSYKEQMDLVKSYLQDTPLGKVGQVMRFMNSLGVVSDPTRLAQIARNKKTTPGALRTAFIDYGRANMDVVQSAMLEMAEARMGSNFRIQDMPANPSRADLVTMLRRVAAVTKDTKGPFQFLAKDLGWMQQFMDLGAPLPQDESFVQWRKRRESFVSALEGQVKEWRRQVAENPENPPKPLFMPSTMRLNPSLFAGGWRDPLEVATRIVTPYKLQQAKMAIETPAALSGTQRGTIFHNLMEKALKAENNPDIQVEMPIEGPLQGFWTAGRADVYNKATGRIVDYKFFSQGSMKSIQEDPEKLSNLRGQIGAYLMTLEGQGMPATGGSFQFYNADIIQAEAAKAMGLKDASRKFVKANEEKINRWISENPEWFQSQIQRMQTSRNPLVYSELNVDLNDETRQFVSEQLKRYEKIAYSVRDLGYNKPVTMPTGTLKDEDPRQWPEEKLQALYQQYKAKQRQVSQALNRQQMPNTSELSLLHQIIQGADNPEQVAAEPTTPQSMVEGLSQEEAAQLRQTRQELNRNLQESSARGGNALGVPFSPAYQSRERQARANMDRRLRRSGGQPDAQRASRASVSPTETISGQTGGTGPVGGETPVSAPPAGSGGGAAGGGGGGATTPPDLPPPPPGGSGGSGGSGSGGFGGSGGASDQGPGIPQPRPSGEILPEARSKFIIGVDVSRRELMGMVSMSREAMPAIQRARASMEEALAGGDTERAVSIASELEKTAQSLSSGMLTPSSVDFSADPTLGADYSEVFQAIKLARVQAKGVIGKVKAQELGSMYADPEQRFAEGLIKGAEALEKFQEPVEALGKALNDANPNIKALGEASKKIAETFDPILKQLKSESVAKAAEQQGPEAKKAYDQMLTQLEKVSQMGKAASQVEERSRLGQLAENLLGGGGRGGRGGARFGALDSFGEFAGLGWLGWAAFSKQRIRNIFQSGVEENVQEFYASRAAEATLGRQLGVEATGAQAYREMLQRRYFSSVVRARAGERLEGLMDIGSKLGQSYLSMDQMVGMETAYEGGKSITGNILDLALSAYIARRLGGGFLKGAGGLLGSLARATGLGGGAAGIGAGGSAVTGAGTGLLSTLGLAAVAGTVAYGGYTAYRSSQDPTYSNMATEFIDFVSRAASSGVRSQGDLQRHGLVQIVQDRKVTQPETVDIGGFQVPFTDYEVPLLSAARQFRGLDANLQPIEPAVYTGDANIFRRGAAYWEDASTDSLTPDEKIRLAEAVRNKKFIGPMGETLSSRINFRSLRGIAEFYGSSSGGIDEAQVLGTIASLTEQFGFTKSEMGDLGSTPSQILFKMLEQAAAEGVSPENIAQVTSQYAKAISPYSLTSEPGRQIMLQVADASARERLLGTQGAAMLSALGPRYTTGIPGASRFGVAQKIGGMVQGLSETDQATLSSIMNPRDQFSYTVGVQAGLYEGTPLVDLNTGLSAWEMPLRENRDRRFMENAAYQMYNLFYQRQSALIGFQRQRTDLGFAMRGAQMRYDYSMANAQRNLSNIQEGLGMTLAERGLSRQIMMTQWGFQDQEREIARGRELQQRQWWYEDFAFGRQRRGLVFGWQQEDLSRNIRLSTGRQKRELIRQRERQETLYGMDEGQKDKELERRKEMDRWRDEDYERRKKQTATLRALQLQLFDMQTAHIQRRAEMQKEAAEAQIAYIEEQRSLELEQFEERKKRIEEDQERFLEHWEKEKTHLETVLELDQQRKDLIDQQADAMGKYNLLLQWQVTHAFPRMLGIARAMKDVLDAAAKSAAETRGSGNDASLPPPPEGNWNDNLDVYKRIQGILDDIRKAQERQ